MADFDENEIQENASRIRETLGDEGIDALTSFARTVGAKSSRAIVESEIMMVAGSKKLMQSNIDDPLTTASGDLDRLLSDREKLVKIMKVYIRSTIDTASTGSEKSRHKQ